MNNQFRQSQPEDQKINEILTAFGVYALGDIKHNIDGEKPISAFILCSCLIDQMASFAYNPNFWEDKDGKHYKKFISEYLPPYYNALKLYTDLRCLLVHGYSVGEYISLSIEPDIDTMPNNTVSAREIYANTLYEDLKKAFEKLSKQILGDKNVRDNALSRYDKHPPLTEARLGLIRYSETEANYLIEFFSDKVKGKIMNNNKALPIARIEKTKIMDDEHPYFVRCVATQYGTNIVEHLDKITQQLNLPYPIQVLIDAGLHQ